MRRRLGGLLTASLMAFTFAEWLLVRQPPGEAFWELTRGPSGVVRAHLDALGRGEVRAAYELFSARFRAENSYVAFQMIVLHRREVFRARLLEITPTREEGGRTAVEARLLSGDGERYVARFTLVESAGQWWIDDLRWRTAPTRRGSRGI